MRQVSAYLGMVPSGCVLVAGMQNGCLGLYSCVGGPLLHMALLTSSCDQSIAVAVALKPQGQAGLVGVDRASFRSLAHPA